MMKTTINEVKVEGVILKRTPYKENDLILHVYTKDYGKIGIIAKGVKKITSKNAGAIQQLMISEFEIHLKKGLSSLVRASSLQYFKHIQESIECEIVANYILEYYYRYIEENNPNIEDYEMLVDSLKALELGYHPLLVYLLFNAFILKHNGVSVEVDGCVVCGQSQVVSISLADGGFVCSEHLRQRRAFDVSVLKAFRHIHKVSIQNIDSLYVDEKLYDELIHIMDAFVEEYTGISLKTKKFIEQIV